MNGRHQKCRENVVQEEVVWAAPGSRPSSVLLLLLPLAPRARQPAFSVSGCPLRRDEGGEGPSRLTLVASLEPASPGPGSRLEVESMLGDGGGGYNHCVQ